MIPVAYIFTDKIEKRFVDAYTSFIYEEFTIDEALEANHESLPNLVNAAIVATCSGINTPKTKVFVIYNPNPSRLSFTLIGDADKLKVLVDSVAKQRQLEDYARHFEAILRLANIHQSFSQGIKNFSVPELSMNNLYASSYNQILNNNTDTIDQLNVIREQLINEFKKNLCF
jgi:hypothetical protein